MAVLYDSLFLYDDNVAYDGTDPEGSPIYEIQQSLSILAGNGGPVYYEAQQAANLYAGTTGLDLQAALNCKYRGVTTIQALSAYQIYDTQYVCNLLAGTIGKDEQDALSNLAGGGHT